jgi:RNA polymerase sigma factor (TIGR02999 family)
VGNGKVTHFRPRHWFNEAYLRLVDSHQVQWQNRAHFFAMAAQLMRRVLVDFVRMRNYQKRGGEILKVEFDEAWMGYTGCGGELLVALDDALEELAKLDPRKSQVVEMRFFGGLSATETAEVLKVSEDTVLRDWKLARTWLFRELKKGDER